MIEANELVGLLALAVPELAPPDDLRARVLARAEREDDFFFRFADDPSWEVRGPAGVTLRRLTPDQAPEGELTLLTLPAGATHLPDDGAGTEHLFVVSGEVESGDGPLSEGDFVALGRRKRVLRSRGAPAVVLSIRLAGPPAGESSTRAVSANDGEWNTLAPGTTFRSLTPNAADQAQIAFVRMDAGASVEGHPHQGTEALFMLSGDCWCAGEELGVGDYHRARAGSTHTVTSTRSGCTMILISYPPSSRAA